MQDLRDGDKKKRSSKSYTVCFRPVWAWGGKREEEEEEGRKEGKKE